MKAKILLFICLCLAAKMNYSQNIIEERDLTDFEQALELIGVKEFKFDFKNTFIVPHYALVSSFTSKTQRYNPPQKTKGIPEPKRTFKSKVMI